VLRRRSETAARGVVAARLVETTLTFVGAVSLLSVVTLRTTSTALRALIRRRWSTSGRSCSRRASCR
jgi:hypothetical protein